MAEILFYHLQRRPMEAVLPHLAQRCLDRGWRVVVQASSPERVRDLDDRLWTFSDESFLPHAAEGDGDCAGEPIVLTSGAANPNGAEMRFLVDGAPLPEDPSAYQRLAVLFDGNDEDALATARAMWRIARDQGHETTYWQEDDDGRWRKMA